MERRSVEEIQGCLVDLYGFLDKAEEERDNPMEIHLAEGWAEAVKVVGDVGVLVQKKDWEGYRGVVETFIPTDFNWFPTKMIEIAIHENYLELQEEFDKEEKE